MCWCDSWWIASSISLEHCTLCVTLGPTKKSDGINRIDLVAISAVDISGDLVDDWRRTRRPSSVEALSDLYTSDHDSLCQWHCTRLPRGRVIALHCHAGSELDAVESIGNKISRTTDVLTNACYHSTVSDWQLKTLNRLFCAESVIDIAATTMTFQ